MFLFYVILCNFIILYAYYMLFRSLLRIAWVMTSQQPFLQNGGKCVFYRYFIEISIKSKMKRLHVNKGFYLLILEKIVDSMLNYS